MPVLIPSVKITSRPLLIVAAIFIPVICNPLAVFADNNKREDWLCVADHQNQWKCSTRSQTASQATQWKSATTLKGFRDTGNKNAGPSSNSDKSQWDWVPAEQLIDPSICKVGCNGAYVSPSFDWPNADKNPENSAIIAEAGSYSDSGEIAKMTGGIEITQGHRRIIADSATLNSKTREASLEGSIEVREPNLLIRADSAKFNTDTGIGSFKQTQFVLHNNNFRGLAQKLHRPSANIMQIEQGEVTQCSPDDETWIFQADNILLDQETGLATLKKAKLKVKGRTVFYTPYMTFPIDDRRTTGFLWPTFGSSDNGGVDITAPYYINIAPNIDATVAPRFISDRGNMLEAEARYRNRYGSWTLAAAGLKDALYIDLQDEENSARIQKLTTKELRELPPKEKRWIVRLKEKGSIAGIRTRIDYNKVGDNEYFRDLTLSSLAVKRTHHLTQMFGLDYGINNWQVGLLTRQRQTIDEDLNNQYKLMPRLSINRNTYSENFSTQLLVQSQFSNYKHEDSIERGGSFVTGQRAYTEIGIRHPMRWPGAFIVPTAKVRHLDYRLIDTVGSSTNTTIDTTTALATLDMGLIFERAASFREKNYIHTLEPRFYYFYSEYKDQDDQPDFDTKDLTFSYNQLFRDSRFSGHDRLDDANQLSIGITSRFIARETGIEVFSANIGQTFYFEDRKVILKKGRSLATRSGSYLTSSLQYQPTERYWLNNHLLWDSQQNKLREGSISFHYQTIGNSLYNLNYRFRRNGDKNPLTGTQNLEQVNSSVLLAVTDRWSVFSRLKYDMTEASSIDSMLGIQYESCCWKLSLLYQKGFEDEYIDRKDNSIEVENDYAFIIEIQLKGLGGLGNKTTNILRNSILGYEDLE